MSKLELTDLSQSSQLFGTAIVTLVNGASRGPSIPCRSCLVKPKKDNTSDVLIGSKAISDRSEYPLSSTDTPVPVTNLNQLYFWSDQLNAQVYIIWRL
jgi:hypothetical protein